MEIVGYLVNTKEGLKGNEGAFYSYVLAGNGLFLKAEKPGLKATVPLAHSEVRGLVPLATEVKLTYGLIPGEIWRRILDDFMSTLSLERYLCLRWDGSYRLAAPPQESGKASVSYEPMRGILLDAHSHNRMEAFFSATDDADDQGFRISMVVGRLDTLEPQVALRLSIYGYFYPLRWEQVFEGPVPAIRQVSYNDPALDECWEA